ncbi:hypothetical protein [Micromonospora chokoriensis]|uniref:hypothetical protein n=1 Tax=Micromonospora chokoriensis TaxID=356851 RepID=UPI000B5B0C70|nr:hypothetical protein [Micromonospora chokoriensis]
MPILAEGRNLGTSVHAESRDRDRGQRLRNVTLVAALLTPTAAHGAPPPPATPAATATGTAHLSRSR